MVPGDFSSVLLTAVMATLAPASAHQQVLGMQGDAGITSGEAHNVRGALKKAEIIPTVLDDFKPSLSLEAKWPSAQALLGNTLRPKKLHDAPTITLSPHDSHRNNHVVVMTDPDAPSRDDPKWSEFCHWIATGSASPHSAGVGQVGSRSSASLRGLEEIVPYKPPGPPKDTGKHRYVIVILAPENGTSKRLHPSKPLEREHWGYGTAGGETRGVRDWAKENGLVPIAANFFFAEH